MRVITSIASFRVLRNAANRYYMFDLSVNGDINLSPDFGAGANATTPVTDIPGETSTTPMSKQNILQANMLLDLLNEDPVSSTLSRDTFLLSSIVYSQI